MRNLKKEKKDQSELDEISISEEELEEAVSETNPYYGKVASIYSAVRYFLFVFLAVFLIISVSRNSDSITYDNFMFLLKDFGSVSEASAGNFGRITYNPDTTLSVSGFRKNLSVVTSTGLKIFEGDGSLLFEGKDKFSKPYIKTSDRYLLVYDFGGNSFALYNSFARIFSEKLDYGITGADVSNSGVFAVATRVKEYNSAVLVYSKNCHLKSRCLSDDRVTDIALNDRGDRLCVLSFDVENSSFVAGIKIVEPGRDKALAELSLGDVFPLGCNFTSDGNLTVLCDKAVYFYDENGSLIGSSPISFEPEAVDMSDGGIALTISENVLGSGSRVMLFSSAGELLYDGEIEGKAATVSYSDGYLFTLSGNILTRINVTTGEKKVTETDGGGKKMIVYSADDVMICSGSSAEYYDFSS